MVKPENRRMPPAKDSGEPSEEDDKAGCLFESEEPKEELDLEYLGMIIVPDDCVNLQRRCSQKQSTPFLHALLEDSNAMRPPTPSYPGFPPTSRMGR